MVRRGVHPGFVRADAGRGQPDGSPDFLPGWGLPLRRRAGPADRDGGRAALPSPPGVPRRHRGQVRESALGRRFWRAPRRGRPLRGGGVLAQRLGRERWRTASRAAPAPRSHRAGRVAPHRRPARHDGRALRSRHRGAGLPSGGRADDPSQDRGLHGHREPRAGPGPGALRAGRDPVLPASRSRPGGLVLRPAGPGDSGARPALPRGRGTGAKPESRHAPGAAPTDGRGAPGVRGSRRQEEPNQPRPIRT